MEILFSFLFLTLFISPVFASVPYIPANITNLEFNLTFENFDRFNGLILIPSSTEDVVYIFNSAVGVNSSNHPAYLKMPSSTDHGAVGLACFSDSFVAVLVLPLEEGFVPFSDASFDKSFYCPPGYGLIAVGS